MRDVKSEGNPSAMPDNGAGTSECELLMRVPRREALKSHITDLLEITRDGHNSPCASRPWFQEAFSARDKIEKGFQVGAGLTNEEKLEGVISDFFRENYRDVYQPVCRARARNITANGGYDRSAAPEWSKTERINVFCNRYFLRFMEYKYNLDIFDIVSISSAAWKCSAASFPEYKREMLEFFIIKDTYKEGVER